MRAPSILRAAVLGLLIAFTGATANAGSVNFDEYPAPNNNAVLVGEEYADLGVHFLPTDDGAVWDGVTNGDVGGWGLEGTNGSAFLGFNGPSYEMAVLFDGPVRDVSFDVSRSNYSSTGDTVTLTGFRDGTLVEEVTVVLDGLNDWQTVQLTSSVDEIQWFGTGLSFFHWFGVDNLSWELDEPAPDPEPEVIPAVIDIRPWLSTNLVRLSDRGMVFVALFGSDFFDVREVDPDTVVFGPNGAPAVYWFRRRDLNRDGLLDFVALHRVAETGLTLEDREACLRGSTFDGVAFEGCDTVRPYVWKSRHHRRCQHKHHRNHRHHGR